MSFFVKVCANKPGDKRGEIQGRVLEVVTAFRLEQQERQELGSFWGPEIDPRIGVLVGRKHTSPDFINIRDATEIIEESPSQTIVVVTHLDGIGELVDMIGETKAETIQLHKKDPDPEFVEELKRWYPDREFWHVIHAPQECGDPTKRRAQKDDTVRKAEQLVEAGIKVIVLDTYNPLTDQVGGTGEEVNLNFAKEFRLAFGKGDHHGRLVIAGGLNSSNVRGKIRDIRPNGVDANSGLNISKSTRVKNPAEVKSFLKNAHEGAYDLHMSGLWVPSQNMS